MNQIQRFIDSIRDAPHDAVIVAGIFAIPVLIALWIVNRMRHPERGLLHALVIASVGFVVVPCVSSAVIILWVRTGGGSIQDYHFGLHGTDRVGDPPPRCNGFRTSATFDTPFPAAPAVECCPIAPFGGAVA